MSYEAALSRAWSELESFIEDKVVSVRLLSDEYSIELKNKRVLSLPGSVPTKDYISILILHYLKKKLVGLPFVTGEWISFKQLEGGLGYYPAFKKRVIEPILRKYGLNPKAILEVVERFGAKRIQAGDLGVLLEPFDGVPVLITLWRGNEEFGPEANILFDKSIKDIFYTEDVVILAEFIVHNI